MMNSMNNTDFPTNYSIDTSKAKTDGGHQECYLLSLGNIYGMMAVNISSAVIGTIGNLLLICSVSKNLNLQTISNFFLVSMAVADLLVTALGQPLFSIFLGFQIDGQCRETVLQLFRLVANMSCSASVLHLCLISIDRCLVILHSHEKSLRTKTRLKLSILLAWVFPIVYGILRLTINKKGTSHFTVISVGICYIAIILCYALIIVKIKKQISDQAIERRLAATMALVVVVFTICWFPLLYLRSAFAEENYGVAYDWARTLALSNSSMNPWIYCFRIAEFPEAYRRLLRCKCSEETDEAPQNQHREMSTAVTRASDLELSQQKTASATTTDEAV